MQTFSRKLLILRKTFNWTLNFRGIFTGHRQLSVCLHVKNVKTNQRAPPAVLPICCSPSLYQLNRNSINSFCKYCMTWRAGVLHPTGAAPRWSLVPHIKSRHFGGWDSHCEARDWCRGIAVGVEACEEWQTFSLEVINANRDIKCYGKSKPHWIYPSVNLTLALLGEDHSDRKNSLCCCRQKRC